MESHLDGASEKSLEIINLNVENYRYKWAFYKKWKDYFSSNIFENTSVKIV